MRLLTSISDACDVTGCKRTKMYELISSGEVVACKIGRKTMITRESLDALIERGIAEANQVWSR